MSPVAPRRPRTAGCLRHHVRMVVCPDCMAELAARQRAEAGAL